MKEEVTAISGDALMFIAECGAQSVTLTGFRLQPLSVSVGSSQKWSHTLKEHAT